MVLQVSKGKYDLAVNKGEVSEALKQPDTGPRFSRESDLISRFVFIWMLK